MTGTYYKFSDGYTTWTVGKLSASEKKNLVSIHGKIILEKKC